jgi:hypothetical protein
MSTAKPRQPFRVGSLDLRSVGAFRIVLGLVVMVNLIRNRWWVVGDYYNAEDTLFPLAWVKQHFGPSSISVFDVLPSDWLVFLFLSVAIVVAILYTLGIGTRFTAPLLWICWWNVNQRNPLLMAGWDAYIEVLLFTTMFLPLSARFSVRPRRHELADDYRSPASWLVLVQIAVIYCVNGLTKNGAAWLDGTAVQRIAEDAVLGADRPVGEGLGRFLTYATLGFEIGFPLLLFFPWKNGIFRLFAALVVLLFHWGVAFFADVGYFKWASLSVLVLLLPGFVWGKIAKRREGESSIEPRWIGWPLYGIATMVVLLGLRTVSGVGFLAKPMQAIAFDKGLKYVIPPKFENASWLNQDWKLYSPNPPKADGWLYVTVTDRFKGVLPARMDKGPHSFAGDAVMPHFVAGMRYRMGDSLYQPALEPWMMFELARFEKDHKEQMPAIQFITIWYHDPSIATDQKLVEAALED